MLIKSLTLIIFFQNFTKNNHLILIDKKTCNYFHQFFKPFFIVSFGKKVLIWFLWVSKLNQAISLKNITFWKIDMKNPHFITSKKGFKNYRQLNLYPVGVLNFPTPRIYIFWKKLILHVHFLPQIKNIQQKIRINNYFKNFEQYFYKRTYKIIFEYFLFLNFFNDPEKSLRGSFYFIKVKRLQLFFSNFIFVFKQFIL